MARLIYTTNSSLDGYIEDRDGKFDWMAPSQEYFKFITNLVREAGTPYLPHWVGIADCLPLFHRLARIIDLTVEPANRANG